MQELQRITRAFYLIRFFLTQVGHFGNDRRRPRSLLGGHHRSTGCRRATESCPTATKWSVSHSSRRTRFPLNLTRVHTVTPPLAPSQPPNWYPFSPPPTRLFVHLDPLLARNRRNQLAN